MQHLMGSSKTDALCGASSPTLPLVRVKHGDVARLMGLGCPDCNRTAIARVSSWLQAALVGIVEEDTRLVVEVEGQGPTADPRTLSDLLARAEALAADLRALLQASTGADPNVGQWWTALHRPYLDAQIQRIQQAQGVQVSL